jgi:anti-anti-sigma factor
VTHPAAEVVVVDGFGVRVASVSGVLDVFSASVVGARVLASLPADTREIVLDLDGIQFMDSAGVSALVRLREHARHRSLIVHARLGAAAHLNPTVIAVLHRVLDCEDVIDLGQADDAPVTRSPVKSAG